MKNNATITSFIINLIIFAVFMAGIHYLIYKVLPESQRPAGIIEMHVFLFLLTIFTYVVLVILLKKKTEYMGYGFIGASFVKMIICILFLLPEITNQKPTTYSYIFQFFGLYFVYLGFEVVMLAKVLKNRQ